MNKPNKKTKKSFLVTNISKPFLRRLISQPFFFLKGIFPFPFYFLKKKIRRKINVLRFYLIIAKDEILYKIVPNWILYLKKPLAKRLPTLPFLGTVPKKILKIKNWKLKIKELERIEFPVFFSLLGWQPRLALVKVRKIVLWPFKHYRQETIFLLLIALIGVLTVFHLSKEPTEATLKQKEAARKHYQEATSYLGAGNLEKAEEYFQNAYQENSFNSAYLWQIAITQKENQKYQEAIKSYDKLITMVPDKPLIYLQQGEIYETIGQKEKAEELYRKAIKVDENYARSYLNLATLLLKQNRIEEAQEIRQTLQK